MTQGQGGSTPRKENGFAMILRQCLRMTKNMDCMYWHIDLNAGCGTNELVNCLGSPLVFLTEAERVGRRFNAMFCEKDVDAAKILSGTIKQRIAERFDGSTVALRCRDNAKSLGEFCEWIADEESPKYARGTLLCDPNGYPHGFPVPAITEFANRHSRIDLVLNVNLSLFARVRPCKGNPTGKTPGFDDFPDPKDVLGLRDSRTHWLVRNPPPGGRGDRFAIFLGRNTDLGMTAFEEFYPIGSPQGDRIVSHLKRVQPDQGYLRGWL